MSGKGIAAALAEEFIKLMQWGPNRTDEEKSLVIGNVRGFSAFVDLALQNGPFESNWKNVTEECRFVEEQNGERAGISHVGPGNAVCMIYGGYRLRRIQVQMIDPQNCMNVIQGWAFIVEKKESL